MHSFKTKKKKCSSFVYLYSLTGTAKIFFRVQLLPGISEEGFHCCRPSVFLLLQKVRISLSCATGTITPAGEGKKKTILAGFLHPKLVKFFFFLHPLLLKRFRLGYLLGFTEDMPTGAPADGGSGISRRLASQSYLLHHL